MTARLASGVLVSALIRKVQADGGAAMVLARGDDMAGALLLVLAERGHIASMRERGMRPDGSSAWIETGPKDADAPGALSEYIARRRRSDPDLWVVELDGITAERVDALLDAISGDR